MEALLSVEEAARKLGGISKWTVHAWLAKGKLRRTKVGSRTMIRESELERVFWMSRTGSNVPADERANAGEGPPKPFLQHERQGAGDRARM